MRIEPRSQDLAEVKMVFGCGDERPECMTKVGRNLEVARLIYGSIRKQAGGYVVLIRQLNVADGTVEKTLSETVPKQILMEPSARLDEIIKVGSASCLSKACAAIWWSAAIRPARWSTSTVSQWVGRRIRSRARCRKPCAENRADRLRPHRKTVQIRGNQAKRSTQLHAQTGAATAPSTTKPASRTNWTPLLRYTSYALYGLAGVTAIAALGTWGPKTRPKSKRTRRSTARSLTLGPRAVDYASFFFTANPACRAAPDLILVGNAAYDALCGCVSQRQSARRCGKRAMDRGGNLRRRRCRHNAEYVLSQERRRGCGSDRRQASQPAGRPFGRPVWSHGSCGIRLLIRPDQKRTSAKRRKRLAEPTPGKAGGMAIGRAFGLIAIGRSDCSVAA